MSRVKILLASGGFVVATAVSGLTGVVSAAPAPVAPVITNTMFCPLADNDADDLCGLGIDKQVSVNGGAYVDANTSATAASAKVGDTVSYKLTLTGNEGQDELTTPGSVYISELLPSNVSFVSSSATSGNYNTVAGSAFANMWAVPLVFSEPDVSGDVVVTNLPATLIITTKAVSTGLQKNSATVAKYSTDETCKAGCAYADPDPTDDSNDAWVNVSAAAVLGASTTTPNTPVTTTTTTPSTTSTPKVLGASTTVGTLTNTGVNTRLIGTIASLIMVTAISVFVYNPLVRKLRPVRQEQ